jgi:hypothetical protein
MNDKPQTINNEGNYFNNVSLFKKTLEKKQLDNKVKNKSSDVNNNDNKFLFKGKKERGLNFSNKEIIGKLICNKCIKSELKQKKEIYEKAEKIIKEKINIVNIIKKIQEIDNLKMVLFDKNQLALFSLMTNYELKCQDQGQENEKGNEICNQDLIEKRMLLVDRNEMEVLVKNFQTNIINEDNYSNNLFNTRLLKYLSNEYAKDNNK